MTAMSINADFSSRFNEPAGCRKANARIPLAASAADSVRFGSDPAPHRAETCWDGFKDGIKQTFSSPLSFWRRIPAFFSPSNLQAGWDKAKAGYHDGVEKHGKFLEIGGLVLDIALGVISHGILFGLNMLFPRLGTSQAYISFFQGVHEASADKRKPPEAGSEPPEGEPPAGETI